ncbi:MAG: Rab family GTPase [Candidatus Odinarchaeota archaeon]
MDEYKFKIVIIGDAGVGKTTLTHRYLSGVFKETYITTLGMDFYLKKLEMSKKLIKLHIWDFAGEEKFRFLLPSAILAAQGTIFMYDITRYNTFKNLTGWLSVFDEANKTHNQKVSTILVASKLDLQENRAVSENEGRIFAEKNKFLEYIECSSKIGENVDYIFDKITQLILETI